MTIIVTVKDVFYGKFSCHKAHQLNLPYNTCFTSGPRPQCSTKNNSNILITNNESSQYKLISQRLIL